MDMEQIGRLSSMRRGDLQPGTEAISLSLSLALRLALSTARGGRTGQTIGGRRMEAVRRRLSILLRGKR